VTRLPFEGGTNGSVLVEGRGPRASTNEGPLVEVASLTGDYLDAMEIPLLQGRHLEPGDSATGAVGVLINRHMAEEVWPGEDPLGKRFSFSDEPPTWWTVVGVVGDTRPWGPEQPVINQTYVPFARGWSSSVFVVVKVAGDPASVAGAVRSAILEVDPTQPPSEITAMDARTESAFAQRRFYTTLIGLFAVAALFLAAAGIYGTVSYFVARRTRELGIRMALGARRTGIMGLVVGRGVRLAVWGLALGLVGAWASTRIVEQLLYGVAALDLLTLLGGCLVLGAVTVAASTVPGFRAVQVPPVLALRSE
jgi:predicted permease